MCIGDAAHGIGAGAKAYLVPRADEKRRPLPMVKQAGNTLWRRAGQYAKGVGISKRAP
jgi:hypothetical protein